MAKSPPRAWLEFDWDALRHNACKVKEFAPHSKVMAVIKADAYGHGMLKAADVLRDHVDAFAVATLEEAIALRVQEKTQSIICLSGWLNELALSALEAAQISPVLFASHQLDWLRSRQAPFQGDIWIKLNTGMNRAGIALDSLSDTLNLVAGKVTGNVRLMSHFSDADSTDETEQQRTRQQIALFESACESITQEHGLNHDRSLANSAGTMAWAAAHYEWVRPGIMLYGSSPFANKAATQLGLKPVMRFKARISCLLKVKKGGCVGYGSTWRAPQDTHVALVSAGYADGYPRHASNVARVSINGTLSPIVGRVSMDSLTVDLNHHDHLPAIGSEVELWGERISADEVAVAADTIAYELFCQAHPRA